MLIVSSFNNTEDNSEDSETEENLVKSSDDLPTKSEKRPTDNNRNKNNSETIKKEIVVLPWIDLTKLSVVTKNWEKIDLATADQDQIIREKLLLNSTASCFNEKKSSNCSGVSAAAEPEVVVNWLKKHQLSVEFQNKIISIQGGLVKLKYPYTANECQSTNLIVLDRVTSILAQMPSTA